MWQPLCKARRSLGGQKEDEYSHPGPPVEWSPWAKYAVCQSPLTKKLRRVADLPEHKWSATQRQKKGTAPTPTTQDFREDKIVNGVVFFEAKKEGC